MNYQNDQELFKVQRECDTKILADEHQRILSLQTGNAFEVDLLLNHSKKVADQLLHMPMRDKEVAPHMHKVIFAHEIETLLVEFCRLLK